MKIDINKDSLAESIQRQFNDCYPFLKIEFFKKQSHGNIFSKRDISTNLLSKDLFITCKILSIDINKDRTVAQLEGDLKEQFNIDAQVLRKSGNVWIETILTNDWTLEQQNEEGKQISSHFPERK